MASPVVAEPMVERSGTRQLPSSIARLISPVSHSRAKKLSEKNATSLRGGAVRGEASPSAAQLRAELSYARKSSHTAPQFCPSLSDPSPPPTVPSHPTLKSTNFSLDLLILNLFPSPSSFSSPFSSHSHQKVSLNTLLTSIL